MPAGQADQTRARVRAGRNGAEYVAMVSHPARPGRRQAAGGGLGGCTANWRGYRAWWALREGRLWLERMVYGACAGDRAPAADLQVYFPGRSAPVVADWYSGTLVVPLGAPGANAHMGYSTAYPRYALVDIQAGTVTATREVDHATWVQLGQAARARANDAAPAADPPVQPR